MIATHCDTIRCGIVIRRIMVTTSAPRVTGPTGPAPRAATPPIATPTEAAPAEAPHRGRPRDPTCDLAILKATIELLAEVGYDRTSIDAVAARAGVSKPTIYRRWPEGKEQLASAAVAQCKADDPVIDTGSLRGDLVASIEHMISGMRENAQLAAGLTQRLRESPQLAQVFRDQIVTAKRERFRALVKRAVARGELAHMPKDISLLSDLAPSIIHSRALIIGGPLDRRFVNHFVDHVLIPALKAAGSEGAGGMTAARSKGARR
jgi:AcrR family transcriptional regulator